MSVRRLAELAEVSNPYLSQIERGLRKPSAEILQQIARALRISAEQLYIRAGILDPAASEALSVPDAIHRDPRLSADQKRSLLTVYESFVGQG
jgi:transcriptional regulator with XRE-family HTH domain